MEIDEKFRFTTFDAGKTFFFIYVLMCIYYVFFPEENPIIFYFVLIFFFFYYFKQWITNNTTASNKLSIPIEKFIMEKFTWQLLWKVYYYCFYCYLLSWWYNQTISTNTCAKLLENSKWKMESGDKQNSMTATVW
jgi:hypothetical protein